MRSRTIGIAGLCGLSLGLCLSGVGGAQPALAPQGPPVAAITLAPATGGAKIKVTSSAFKADGKLPETFTQNGKNISPPLSWTKGPKSTMSYVLITEDMGGNRPDPTIHWVMYDIPAAVTSLPQAVPTEAKPAAPAGAMQGLNVRKAAGFLGPKPPMGVTHPYHFEVFALDAVLGLDPAKTDRKSVVAAMTGHVLASGELVASYMTPQPPYDHRDLTGVWMQVGARAFRDYPLTPEYAAILKKRKDDEAAGRPFNIAGGTCLPAGLVGSMTTGAYPIEIFYQTGGKEILFQKEIIGALYRVYLNRPHKSADDLRPLYYGDSIGHWDGDTLVVDTIALGGSQAFDLLTPHSDALHAVQRLTRIRYDTLEDQITVDDSKALTHWISATVNFTLHPDWEIQEYECTNERFETDDKGYEKIIPAPK